MLGDSLVLKQDLLYYEYFYMVLEFWKYYVLIKRNLSDLLEKVKWVKENDEEVEKIVKEGQLMVRDLLQLYRFYCYYYEVLQKYVECQFSKFEVCDGMEFVFQLEDNIVICQCYRKKFLREEF